MWQKYHKIAQRQLEARKYKSVEQHALKALDFARKANDAKQMAQTLTLLCDLYCFTDDPKLFETRPESVRVAELAYGADSVELSDQLSWVAYELERSGKIEESLQARERAIKILEKLGNERARLIDLLSDAVNAHMDESKFAEAEVLFLKMLDVFKKEHGAVNGHIERAAVMYLEILKGLGRSDEVLDSIVNSCAKCTDEETAKKNHHHHHPELKQFESTFEKALENQDYDLALESTREGIQRFAALSKEAADAADPSDPFRELKAHRYDYENGLLEANLAAMLRLRGFEKRNLQDLVEAEQVLRQIILEVETPSLQGQLVSALIEQHLLGASVDFGKIEKEINQLPMNTARMYSDALVQFIRFGSTPESRAKMMHAIRENPHVPLIMSSGGDLSAEPEAEFSKHRLEAVEYCLEAMHHWSETPGGAEFIADVIRRSIHSNSEKLPILG